MQPYLFSMKPVITFGLHPPLPFPGRPEPSAVGLVFLLQPFLQSRLGALRRADGLQSGINPMTGREHNNERKVFVWTHFCSVLSQQRQYEVRFKTLIKLGWEWWGGGLTKSDSVPSSSPSSSPDSSDSCSSFTSTQENKLKGLLAVFYRESQNVLFWSWTQKNVKSLLSGYIHSSLQLQQKGIS